MKYTKFITLCIIVWSSVMPINAKIHLPQIIGDNMILQQNSNAKIWGWATPGEVIKISCSWNHSIIIAKAATDSSWSVNIKTPNGSYQPQSLSISGNGNVDNIKINNLLIGEVWFASGQSNMEMPLNGFNNCPIENANQEIAFSEEYRNKIHYLTVSKVGGGYTPQKEVDGKWQESTPQTTPWFGATAWYFAKALNKSLNVPIGIINCSWGGSKVEGWLNQETLKNYSDIDLSNIPTQKLDVFYLSPLVMYNGMLHPLEGYTIKGFIWYQGESNVGKESTYTDRLADMIKLWRKEWKQGDLPFYYVEIAPYNYGGKRQGALLREAQYKVQKNVPNCGMISTNDLVSDFELNQIHPKNKSSVGERLAFMALNNTYENKSIECRGPEYQSIKIDGDKAYIKFNYDENGFNRSDGVIGFEIAGADSIFYPANAKLDWQRKMLVVTSPNVKMPVAVRYAFKDFLIGNLANTRGLPAIPFRTDNWAIK